MRTRYEVGPYARNEGEHLFVDDLLHHSAFPGRAWAAIGVVCLKKLESLVLFHRHHHHDRPTMLGNRHRFCAGQVD